MSRLTSSKANKVSATALLSLPSCRRNSRLALLTVGELEEAAVNIPKTLPEALRLAADLAEQKMQLENQLAIAAPKVELPIALARPAEF